MYFRALATDYDGTLATDGKVGRSTDDVLKRLKEAGYRLILVSGRERADLLRVYPQVGVFDRLVLENGAIMIRPGDEKVCLAERPPHALIERLRERGVAPLSCGDVIVSTWEPNERIVLEAIRELGLEHQVIFNKGAVMVLPPGVNKATGLRAALEDLKLSPHNVVGVGDAENDSSFLAICGCAVAVGNSLPSIKERADVVTAGARGDGVIEIAERMLGNDLADVATPHRHRIVMGDDGAVARLSWPERNESVLIAGTSGSGKSTLVQGILERQQERGYQFCVVDPEGDYEQLADAFTAGTQSRAPTTAEVLEILANPSANVVVNLLAIALPERPSFFMGLSSDLLQLRLRTGRPHLIVVDEAHHMLLPEGQTGARDLPLELDDLIMVTVHADQLAASALAKVKLIIAVGDSVQETIRDFCRRTGRRVPHLPEAALTLRQALIWSVGAPRAVAVTRPEPRGERRRHIRKYAQGQLGEDNSFYFRGPENRLNLRAHNLAMFIQIAEGVDNETWLHHLRAKDYSRWLRDAIKDAELAHDVEMAEIAAGSDVKASRDRIFTAITRRYTAPASGG